MQIFRPNNFIQCVCVLPGAGGGEQQADQGQGVGGGPLGGRRCLRHTTARRAATAPAADGKLTAAHRQRHTKSTHCSTLPASH